MSRLSQVITSAVNGLNAAGATYIEQFDAQGAQVAGQQASRTEVHDANYSAKLAEVQATKQTRLDQIAGERASRLDAIAAVLGNPGDGAEVETVMGLYQKVQDAAGSWETLVENEKDSKLADVQALSDEYGTFGSVDLS